MRARRHAGDVTAGEGRYGNGYLTSDGYIATAQTGHPLARSKGQVQAHRLILFAKIGFGPHLCHWCRKPISWGYHVGPDTIVADHLDENRANNAPENLVPSCNRCNAARSRYGWS
jgi:5-methylcytosine-specific restriction endonuclease McrA